MDEPIKQEVIATDEPMPFSWRVTDKGEGEVQIDVGETFPDKVLKRGMDQVSGYVALGMVMKGLRIYGVDEPTRMLIGQMMLQMKD